jgi:hypothetical protein
MLSVSPKRNSFDEFITNGSRKDSDPIGDESMDEDEIRGRDKLPSMPMARELSNERTGAAMMKDDTEMREEAER